MQHVLLQVRQGNDVSEFPFMLPPIICKTLPPSVLLLATLQSLSKSRLASYIKSYNGVIIHEAGHDLCVIEMGSIRPVEDSSMEWPIFLNTDSLAHRGLLIITTMVLNIVAVDLLTIAPSSDWKTGRG